MSAIASLSNVTKRFGDTVALDGVDLTLDRGQVLALLGPNGAGKTTAISLLTGLRTPDSGTVELFGENPRSRSARTRFGITLQENELPPTIRVCELLAFAAAHYPNPEPGAALAERFGLADLMNRQAGGLSGGQRRRVSAALAFIGKPEILFLDEPSTGLDAEARQAIWDHVRDFQAAGGAILLTTHYSEEAEALASHIAVIAGGRILAHDSASAIRGRVDKRRIVYAGERAPDLPPEDRVSLIDGFVIIDTDDADRVLRTLLAAGRPLPGLTIRSATLDEAVASITQMGAS